MNTKSFGGEKKIRYRNTDLVFLKFDLRQGIIFFLIQIPNNFFEHATLFRLINNFDLKKI